MLLPVDSKQIPLLITVAAETFHSHSQFAPDMETLRDDPYHRHKGQVQRARQYACIWSFMIAVAVAYATDSTAAIWIWIVVTAGSYMLYEYNMRLPAADYDEG